MVGSRFGRRYTFPMPFGTWKRRRHRRFSSFLLTGLFHFLYNSHTCCYFLLILVEFQDRSEWFKTEKLLQRRYAEVNGVNERFEILGYEWRSLKFNHETRQSTVKVMTGRTGTGSNSTFVMQLPHCLATPCM